ncbi:hypothetical protein BKA69DRAFT_1121137 [Paraphysoderma sedebokerense]|nr:hypothetical protein BKA69DRAFT_1121137 [Paraphysoderma sedebokerense]
MSAELPPNLDSSWPPEDGITLTSSTISIARELYLREKANGRPLTPELIHEILHPYDPPVVKSQSLSEKIKGKVRDVKKEELIGKWSELNKEVANVTKRGFGARMEMERGKLHAENHFESQLNKSKDMGILQNVIRAISPSFRSITPTPSTNKANVTGMRSADSAPSSPTRPLLKVVTRLPQPPTSPILSAFYQQTVNNKSETRGAKDFGYGVLTGKKMGQSTPASVVGCTGMENASPSIQPEIPENKNGTKNTSDSNDILAKLLNGSSTCLDMIQRKSILDRQRSIGRLCLERLNDAENNEQLFEIMNPIDIKKVEIGGKEEIHNLHEAGIEKNGTAFLSETSPTENMVTALDPPIPDSQVGVTMQLEETNVDIEGGVIDSDSRSSSSISLGSSGTGEIDAPVDGNPGSGEIIPVIETVGSELIESAAENYKKGNAPASDPPDEEYMDAPPDRDTIKDVLSNSDEGDIRGFHKLITQPLKNQNQLDSAVDTKSPDCPISSIDSSSQPSSVGSNAEIQHKLTAPQEPPLDQNEIDQLEKNILDCLQWLDTTTETIFKRVPNEFLGDYADNTKCAISLLPGITAYSEDLDTYRGMLKRYEDELINYEPNIERIETSKVASQEILHLQNAVTIKHHELKSILNRFTTSLDFVSQLNATLVELQVITHGIEGLKTKTSFLQNTDILSLDSIHFSDCQNSYRNLLKSLNIVTEQCSVLVKSHQAVSSTLTAATHDLEYVDQIISSILFNIQRYIEQEMEHLMDNMQVNRRDLNGMADLINPLLDKPEENALELLCEHQLKSENLEISVNELAARMVLFECFFDRLADVLKDTKYRRGIKELSTSVSTLSTEIRDGNAALKLKIKNLKMAFGESKRQNLIKAADDLYSEMDHLYLALSQLTYSAGNFEATVGNAQSQNALFVERLQSWDVQVQLYFKEIMEKEDDIFIDKRQDLNQKRQELSESLFDKINLIQKLNEFRNESKAIMDSLQRCQSTLNLWLKRIVSESFTPSEEIEALIAAVDKCHSIYELKSKEFTELRMRYLLLTAAFNENEDNYFTIQIEQIWSVLDDCGDLIRRIRKKYFNFKEKMNLEIKIDLSSTAVKNAKSKLETPLSLNKLKEIEQTLVSDIGELKRAASEIRLISQSSSESNLPDSFKLPAKVDEALEISNQVTMKLSNQLSVKSELSVLQKRLNHAIADLIHNISISVVMEDDSGDVCHCEHAQTILHEWLDARNHLQDDFGRLNYLSQQYSPDLCAQEVADTASVLHSWNRLQSMLTVQEQKFTGLRRMCQFVLDAAIIDDTISRILSDLTTASPSDLDYEDMNKRISQIRDTYSKVLELYDDSDSHPRFLEYRSTQHSKIHQLNAVLAVQREIAFKLERSVTYQKLESQACVVDDWLTEMLKQLSSGWKIPSDVWNSKEFSAIDEKETRLQHIEERIAEFELSHLRPMKDALTMCLSMAGENDCDRQIKLQQLTIDEKLKKVRSTLERRFIGLRVDYKSKTYLKKACALTRDIEILREDFAKAGKSYQIIEELKQKGHDLESIIEQLSAEFQSIMMHSVIQDKHSELLKSLSETQTQIEKSLQIIRAEMEDEGSISVLQDEASRLHAWSKRLSHLLASILEAVVSPEHCQDSESRATVSAANSLSSLNEFVYPTSFPSPSLSLPIEYFESIERIGDVISSYEMLMSSDYATVKTDPLLHFENIENAVVKLCESVDMLIVANKRLMGHENVLRLFSDLQSTIGSLQEALKDCHNKIQDFELSGDFYKQSSELHKDIANELTKIQTLINSPNESVDIVVMRRGLKNTREGYGRCEAMHMSLTNRAKELIVSSKLKNLDPIKKHNETLQFTWKMFSRNFKLLEARLLDIIECSVYDEQLSGVLMKISDIQQKLEIQDVSADPNVMIEFKALVCQVQNEVETITSPTFSSIAGSSKLYEELRKTTIDKLAHLRMSLNLREERLATEKCMQERISQIQSLQECIQNQLGALKNNRIYFDTTQSIDPTLLSSMQKIHDEASMKIIEMGPLIDKISVDSKLVDDNPASQALIKAKELHLNYREAHEVIASFQKDLQSYLHAMKWKEIIDDLKNQFTNIEGQIAGINFNAPNELLQTVKSQLQQYRMQLLSMEKTYCEAAISSEVQKYCDQNLRLMLKEFADLNEKFDLKSKAFGQVAQWVKDANSLKEDATSIKNQIDSLKGNYFPSEYTINEIEHRIISIEHNSGLLYYQYDNDLFDCESVESIQKDIQSAMADLKSSWNDYSELRQMQHEFEVVKEKISSIGNQLSAYNQLGPMPASQHNTTPFATISTLLHETVESINCLKCNHQTIFSKSPEFSEQMNSVSAQCEQLGSIISSKQQCHDNVLAYLVDAETLEEELHAQIDIVKHADPLLNQKVAEEFATIIEADKEHVARLRVQCEALSVPPLCQRQGQIESTFSRLLFEWDYLIFRRQESSILEEYPSRVSHRSDETYPLLNQGSRSVCAADPATPIEGILLTPESFKLIEPWTLNLTEIEKAMAAIELSEQRENKCHLGDLINDGLTSINNIRRLIAESDQHQFRVMLHPYLHYIENIERKIKVYIHQSQVTAEIAEIEELLATKILSHNILDEVEAKLVAAKDKVTGILRPECTFAYVEINSKLEKLLKLHWRKTNEYELSQYFIKRIQRLRHQLADCLKSITAKTTLCFQIDTTWNHAFVEKSMKLSRESVKKAEEILNGIDNQRNELIEDGYQLELLSDGNIATVELRELESDYQKLQSVLSEAKSSLQLADECIAYKSARSSIKSLVADLKKCMASESTCPPSELQNNLDLLKFQVGHTTTQFRNLFEISHTISENHQVLLSEYENILRDADNLKNNFQVSSVLSSIENQASELDSELEYLKNEVATMDFSQNHKDEISQKIDICVKYISGLASEIEKLIQTTVSQQSTTCVPEEIQQKLKTLFDKAMMLKKKFQLSADEYSRQQQSLIELMAQRDQLSQEIKNLQDKIDSIPNESTSSIYKELWRKVKDLNCRANSLVDQYHHMSGSNKQFKVILTSIQQQFSEMHTSLLYKHQFHSIMHVYPKIMAHGDEVLLRYKKLLKHHLNVLKRLDQMDGPSLRAEVYKQTASDIEISELDVKVEKIKKQGNHLIKILDDRSKTDLEAMLHELKYCRERLKKVMNKSRAGLMSRNTAEKIEYE